VAQLVVRNIEAGIKLRLQRRAKQHGRSLEEEVRVILRDAAKEEATPARGLGTEIASLFRKVGLDADISKLRGKGIKSASFNTARRRSLARLRGGFNLRWTPPRLRTELHER
jgi:plasmid stability protein